MSHNRKLGKPTDQRIAMLRAYNDTNIREEVKRDKGLMMELVRRYYHCG